MAHRWQHQLKRPWRHNLWRSRPVVAAPVAKPVAAALKLHPQACPACNPSRCRWKPCRRVAAASGLQWVKSDSEKIAAVQAAIAAEPKPVHVPRERPRGGAGRRPAGAGGNPPRPGRHDAAV